MEIFLFCLFLIYVFQWRVVPAMSINGGPGTVDSSPQLDPVVQQPPIQSATSSKPSVPLEVVPLLSQSQSSNLTQADTDTLVQVYYALCPPHTHMYIYLYILQHTHIYIIVFSYSRMLILNSLQRQNDLLKRQKLLEEQQAQIAADLLREQVCTLDMCVTVRDPLMH